MIPDKSALVSASHRAALLGVRPRTPNQLHAWIRAVLGVGVPRAAMSPGSTAPFAYLLHTFFEDRKPGTPNDCVVWACRGGGKTYLSALATVLDMIHKPGIEVRILGGSLEQSRRMHEHLRGFLMRPPLQELVEGKLTDRRVTLANGSRCEIMAHSHTSVRGAHPHILRCDEVELFDREVWEAAQMLPRSEQLGDVRVHGRIESFSTMHVPYGLMHEIISEGESKRAIFRWGIVDVLALCEPKKPCETCVLEPECGGSAKSACGHVAVQDVEATKRRVSRSSWEAEMLCQRPSRDDAVYQEFDPDIHVAEFVPVESWRWIMGMDFGFRAPTVLLWGALDADNILRIVDVHAQQRATLDKHIELIKQSRWPKPDWVGVDPAGRQRNDQTGLSPVAVLRRAGFTVRDRQSGLQRGIEAVRARLSPAAGSATLLIHPRCQSLCEALSAYHYPSDRPFSVEPVKDGPDHLCDALRYMVVSLDSRTKSACHRY
jgi:Terminase RNaseH-like domain